MVKQVLEALERNAEGIKTGRSDWSRIADCFVLWLVENTGTKTFQDFLYFIETEASEWLEDGVLWDSFFGVMDEKKFIEAWINEEDIQSFTKFLVEYCS
jgi:hypothetical protein